MTAIGRRPRAALLLTMLLCAPSVMHAAAPVTRAAPGVVSPAHRIVPLRSARSFAPIEPAHLSYYGGPVISSVRVVMVLYGSGVDAQVMSSLPDFYQQMANSSHLDWLCEYDTNILDAYGRPGTQQLIGRGSFVSQVLIAPAPGRDGSTITDTDVQNELAAQFAASALPQPDSSTLYMVHFPPGKTISLDGYLSCEYFCGYHNCFYDNGRPVRYGVIPDFSGDCSFGCGYGTAFEQLTQTAWHELAESITDPDTALAWYDWGYFSAGNPWGEVADICEYGQDSVTVIGGDGVAYVVQTLWSNLQDACTITGASCATLAVEDDSASPVSLELEGPNPSSGRARFRIGLPASSEADLSIYDAAGRRVAGVIRGVLAPGSHFAVWDPGGARSAGVYFARLRVGADVRSRTVILLR